MNQKLENDADHPPSGIFSKIKKYFRNPFFIKTQSVSEITDFLKDAVDLNIIDKEAESIANKAIRLGKTTIKEIMVPKVDMVTISLGEETSVIIERIIESGHSRYPVLGDERDEVMGILLAKDILPKIVSGNNNFNVLEMLREPNIVPETKKADSLLEEFKKDRSHLAVAIDEYGSISGLVTIEDILEELVGEIEDEHDVDEEEIVRISEGLYSADAKVEIEEFIEFFELKIDPMEVDAETLGGFIISQFGILPGVGDKLEVENLNIENLDWILSYQSRVGPLKWIGPSTEDIIIETSKVGKHIVLVPIAFVSEHSETLVELDIEYKEIADANGCKNYTRVPALGINEDFIKAMSELIIKKNEYKFSENLYPPKTQCPSNFKKCPCLNYE